MFNFGANRLLLLSQTEYLNCAVLLIRDDSTRRVYRLHDFTKLLPITQKRRKMNIQPAACAESFWNL